MLQVTLNLDDYAPNGIISFFSLFGIKTPSPIPSPNKTNKCCYVLDFLQNGHLTNRSEITNFITKKKKQTKDDGKPLD